MITLPKEWANSVGLNKNDTINVQAQPDGTLLLFPRGVQPLAQKRTSKSIDVTDVTDLKFIYRELIGAYIAGHTTIMVKSAQPMSKELTSVVSSFVQTAMGLEMIEADESHILIANLIEHEAIDMKKIVERMGSLVKNNVKDVYHAVQTGDYSRIGNMAVKDSEINRIYWLTHRQYNMYQKNLTSLTKDGPSMLKFTGCLFLSRVLEGIGDHVVSVSKFILGIKGGGSPIKLDPFVAELGERIIANLDLSIKSWINLDIELAHQAIKEADELVIDAERSMVGNLKSSERSSLNAVLELFTIVVAEYCKYISEFSFSASME